ncbi:MAG: cache domain-containing protein [Pseudomonadota bacterium]
MMKKWFAVALAAWVLAFGAGLALAQDQSEEAKATVDKALAMVKEKGLDPTLAAIGDKNGPFVKGDLYIFVGDIDKVANVVHPINPNLVGKDFRAVKDVNGKLFYLDFVNAAKKGSGWVEYAWPKPGEKAPSTKRSYIARVPDTTLFFACGFYK